MIPGTITLLYSIQTPTFITTNRGNVATDVVADVADVATDVVADVADVATDNERGCSGCGNG